MPNQLTTTSDETGKPGNNDRGTVRALQERQDREDHDHKEAVQRYTISGAVRQDFWCSAFQRQTVQCAHSGVGVCVAGRKDRCQHESVLIRIWLALDVIWGLTH